MLINIRNFDIALSLVLKLLFLHDIFYNFSMFFMEIFMYKRYSDTLVASKSKDSVLLMCPNKKFLSKVQNRDYFKEEVVLLLLLKNDFCQGLNKLDFTTQSTFTVEANERFYFLINHRSAVNDENYNVKLLKRVRRKQVGAKLLLVSSSFLWKCILSGKLSALILKLFREETVLTIQIEKYQHSSIHELKKEYLPSA